MTEKGSDQLLAEIVDPASVTGLADEEQAELADEEARVADTAPADDEPGEEHADPDQTPEGDPPDYDPLPPEEAT